MTKIQNAFGTFGFMILNLFRISDFVLRVSFVFSELSVSKAKFCLFGYKVLNPLDQSWLVGPFLHDIEPDEVRFFRQQSGFF